ncbi:Alpha/Beta hydrolase protein [Pavlovales sp. CCMP2436]|nr:Alpha/Beta hydrolase protein [Pavlovales sp. CCMP2436]|mmetsp:Transcript_25786/g.65419  ORF Transcript_25786/g.65419 Transcript_25786/m.65419 type:complete len:340 (-) Transcript_25786:78-1097(-)
MLAEGLTSSGRLAFLRGRLGRSTPGEPLLLLTHGAGFNAGVWRPTLQHLPATLPATLSAEVISLDWTGHGSSQSPSGSGVSAERYEWGAIAPRDVFELLGECRRAGQPVFGIGHSFGGAGLLLAELERPGTFSGLVLIEPIVRPSDLQASHPLVERTMRRRAHFALSSAVQLVDHFAKRAYASWHRDALTGYVERGFRSTGAESHSFELTCAPETEASVYLGGMQNGVWEALPRVACPCTLAAGEKSETLAIDSATSNEGMHRLIAARLSGCKLPLALALGCGHSVPMENPAWTARLIAASLAHFTSLHSTSPACEAACEWAQLQAEQPHGLGSPRSRL